MKKLHAALVVFSVLSFGCHESEKTEEKSNDANKAPPQIQTPSMKVSYDSVIQVKAHLIGNMTKYMCFGASESKDDPNYDSKFNAGYTQADIDKCSLILDKYLNNVQYSPVENKNANILSAVKTTVIELNVLNSGCHYRLIETGQREDICLFISKSAKIAGLISDKSDITEEWREW